MNVAIADRLQKMRKAHGYSQEELADKLGVSRQAISKWERAESSPDTDNLILLARLYGVSLDELLSEDASIEEIRQRNEQKEDAVRLTDDERQTLEIKDGHVRCLDEDGEEIPLDKKRIKINVLIYALTALVTLVAFAVWGAIFNGWGYCWLLWVYYPAVASIGEAIMRRKMGSFNFAVLASAVYLTLGMAFGCWHPAWIIFLLIPIYYTIAGFIDKLKK